MNIPEATTTNPVREVIGTVEFDLNAVRRYVVRTILYPSERAALTRPPRRGLWVRAVEEEGDVRLAEILHYDPQSELLTLKLVPRADLGDVIPNNHPTSEQP